MFAADPKLFARHNRFTQRIDVRTRTQQWAHDALRPTEIGFVVAGIIEQKVAWARFRRNVQPAPPRTFDEVVAAKDSRELDDAEIDAVAGDWTVCLGPGVSNEVSATCASNVEGHACSYFGFGWFAGKGND